MAKATINGVTFEGDYIKVEKNLIWVDGKLVAGVRPATPAMLVLCETANAISESNSISTKIR